MALSGSRQRVEARMAARGWHGNAIDGYVHRDTGARIERAISWVLVSGGERSDPYPDLGLALHAWAVSEPGSRWCRALGVRIRDIRRRFRAKTLMQDLPFLPEKR